MCLTNKKIKKKVFFGLAPKKNRKETTLENHTLPTHEKLIEKYLWANGKIRERDEYRGLLQALKDVKSFGDDLVINPEVVQRMKELVVTYQKEYEQAAVEYNNHGNVFASHSYGMSSRNYVFNNTPLFSPCISEIEEAKSYCMKTGCVHLSAHSAYRCGDCKTVYCSRKCMADDWNDKYCSHKPLCRLIAPYATLDYALLTYPLLCKGKLQGDKNKMTLTGIGLNELFSCEESATPQAKKLYEKLKELVKKRNEYIQVCSASTFIIAHAAFKPVFTIEGPGSFVINDTPVEPRRPEEMEIVGNITALEFIMSRDERVLKMKNYARYYDIIVNQLNNFDWNPFDMKEFADTEEQNLKMSVMLGAMFRHKDVSGSPLPSDIEQSK